MRVAYLPSARLMKRDQVKPPQAVARLFNLSRPDLETLEALNSRENT